MVVTLPDLPVVWVRQGAPRKVATFVVAVGDGAGPAGKARPGRPGRPGTAQLRRDLQGAYDRDVQSDGKNRGRLPGLADELRQLADRAHGATFLRELAAFSVEAGKGLQATRTAVLKHLGGAVRRGPKGKLRAADRQAAAGALGQVQ